MSSRPTSASSAPAMQPLYESVLTQKQDQLLTPKQDQWHKRQTIVGPSSSCPSLDDNEIPLWPQYCWTHNNHTYLVRSGEETFSFLLLKRQIFLYWLMTWQEKSLIPSLLLLFLDKIWEKVQGPRSVVVVIIFGQNMREGPELIFGIRRSLQGARWKFGAFKGNLAFEIMLLLLLLLQL